jgi:hypothetical protein
LTFDFLESRDGDLEKLNREKLGRKYASPWSFIELMMMIHVIFRLPYRQIECFLRKLSGLIPEIKSANYTNIWRHAAKLKVGLQQLMAGTRKFNVSEIKRDDLMALTEEASKVSGIPYVMDSYRDKAEEILGV